MLKSLYQPLAVLSLHLERLPVVVAPVYDSEVFGVAKIWDVDLVEALQTWREWMFLALRVFSLLSENML